ARHRRDVSQCFQRTRPDRERDRRLPVRSSHHVLSIQSPARQRVTGSHSVLTRVNRPRQDRRTGQAAILVILSMSLVLIGTIGFAIDGGQMYTQRQMAQGAADAAAQAGIMSILRGTNATASNTFATGSPPIASYTCSTTDGTTPCVYARYNG